MQWKMWMLLTGLCVLTTSPVLAAEHVAVVEKDGKEGVIDQSGRLLLQTKYKNIQRGNPAEDPVILAEKDGKYGIYDRDGKEILAPVLKKMTAVNDGMVGGLTKKWNFYTLQGQKLPGDYDAVQAFQEDLAAVKIDGKWGFVDKAGKLVIAPQYKEVRGFSEGLAAVKDGNQWFYIRKDGSVLPSVSVKNPGDFHQGVAIVDKVWLMDTTGKRYAKLKNYSYIGDFQDNGLAAVGVRRASRSFLDYLSIGWGWGSGWGWGGPYWGIGPGWGWGPYFGGYGYRHHHHYHHGWGGSIGISPGMVMPRNMYRGYVNKQGQEVIPPQYSYVSEFFGDYALYRDDGHWGMLNRKGEVKIPAAYDTLWPFSNGLAAFAADKKWGFIGENNQVVIPNRFDRVTSFLEDRATATEKKKSGIIDKKGNPVAPFKEEYVEMGPLAANRAAYQSKKTGKWGYTDENGSSVIAPQYDKAGDFD